MYYGSRPRRPDAFFPDNWDASHIPSLKDKVTIVTGATLASTSSGPSSLLVTAGVVLACRNPERSAAAAEAIREEMRRIQARSDRRDHFRHELESSVKTFSDEFLKHHQKLDILVNNAGCMGFHTRKASTALNSWWRPTTWVPSL
ncbi:NAD(P)-binding domain [Phytophthora cactorum]|nr:NAD(P)-binding domain [Phytophthora cactorum]